MTANFHSIHYFYGLLVFLQMTFDSGSQLVINVENQGGEILQETIVSNVSDDIVELEFQKIDGTLITQVIDFRNEIRIIRTLVPGEEERGENHLHAMCFITKLNKDDFISTDAISKLRQRNANRVRIPDEEKSKEMFTMTAWINLNRISIIPKYLSNLCLNASNATYIRESDFNSKSEQLGTSIFNFKSIIRPFPTSISLRCNEMTETWLPCYCTVEICIGWYPCGLKYCKNNKDQQFEQISTNYRCGIKTCRKCSQFIYYVREKQHCLWDE